MGEDSPDIAAWSLALILQPGRGWGGGGIALILWWGVGSPDIAAGGIAGVGGDPDIAGVGGGWGEGIRHPPASLRGWRRVSL